MSDYTYEPLYLNHVGSLAAHAFEQYTQARVTYSDLLEERKNMLNSFDDTVNVKTFVIENVNEDGSDDLTPKDKAKFWLSVDKFIQQNESKDWCYSHTINELMCDEDPYDDYVVYNLHVHVFAHVKNKETFEQQESYKNITDDLCNALEELKRAEREFIHAVKRMEDKQ